MHRSPLVRTAASRLSLARSVLARALPVLLTLVCVGALRAHDPGISTLSVERAKSGWTATLGLAPADLAMVCNLADEAALHAFARRAVVLRGPLGPLLPSRATVRREGGDSESIFLGLHFDDAHAANPIAVEFAAFDQLARGHRCLATLIEGDEVTAEALLGPARRGMTLDVEARQGLLALAGEFVVLGIEHILIGWDHILFLLSLLIVSRGWRSIVATISAFTVAHSITLCMASLQLVTLPSNVVEATIAFSVVVVAIDNVVRRGRVGRERWMVTAAFGLVHGFGFASVLAELGPGSTSSPTVALGAFNVGVELGQLAIAAVVAPVFAFAIQRSRAGQRVFAPAFSIMVAAIGVYWLCERTIGF